MIGIRLCVAALLLFGSALCQLASAAAQSANSSIEEAFATSLMGLPQQPLSVAGSIYVPVYSSVSIVPGKLRANFSITLSIHNASRGKSLVLKRIAYFDTAGELVENYLQGPVALRPFAAVEIFVSQQDVRGGTGANFVIDWAAAGQMAEPVVQALMIGGIGAGHYTFVSQGRSISMIGSN